LAHAFLWEHNYKKLKLAQLLGQFGVLLTCRAIREPTGCLYGEWTEPEEQGVSRMMAWKVLGSASVWVCTRAVRHPPNRPRLNGESLHARAIMAVRNGRKPSFRRAAPARSAARRSPRRLRPASRPTDASANQPKAGTRFWVCPGHGAAPAGVHWPRGSAAEGTFGTALAASKTAAPPTARGKYPQASHTALHTTLRAAREYEALRQRQGSPELSCAQPNGKVGEVAPPVPSAHLSRQSSIMACTEGRA
jgi:hypothetical protein